MHQRLLLSAFVLSAAVSAQTLLYDNGPLITHPAGGSGGADASALENTTLGHTIYGHGAQRTATVDNRLSESFLSCGMVVNELVFFAYQTASGNNSTITECRVAVSAENPEDPNYLTTPALFGDKTLATNFMTSTQWSGIYRTLESNYATDTNRPIMEVRVAINPPLILNAGRYYLYWQFAGSTTSGPWVPPITIPSVHVTGNGRQHINATPPGTWQDTLHGNNDATGMPFQIWGINGGVAADAQVYGMAKSGTNGIPAWTVQRPFPGYENYPIEINNGLAGSSPIIVVGSGRVNFPLPPFGTFYTLPIFSFPSVPFDSNGVSTLRIPVPNTCGGPINMQGFFPDPGATGGIAHTDGLELTIGT